MITVPFIYFSLLGYYLYRRRQRVDIATLISLMFAVSGFFSIIVFNFNIFDKYQISIGATIAYCGLITLGLLPFILYSNISIKTIFPVKNENPLRNVAVCAIVWFSLYLFFSFYSVVRILTGDIAELRQMVYNGTFDEIANAPTAIRPIMTLGNMVFGCPWVLLFLAFFCRLIQKMRIKYFWMFFIASLSGPLSGILYVDRSRTTYWIISLLAVFLFFKPYMTRKFRRSISIVLFILVLFALSYIALVTDSRFGENGSGNLTGNQVGVISYLGQVFPNFCYFFDSFESPLKTLNILFPFTSKFLFGETMVGGTVIQQMIELKTGVSTGVFYTYIGQIIMASGLTVAIVFCIVHYIVSYFCAQKVCRSSATLFSCMLYFALSSVLFLGLFVYYYSTYSITFGLFFFLIFTRLMENKKYKFS